MTRSDSEEEDDYGNAIDTETAAETVCEIQQRRRDEPGDQGELSATDWLGIFPVGSSLDTASAVVVEDLGTFELVGAPWPARNPRTQEESHIEATLTRTAGPEDEAS